MDKNTTRKILFTKPRDITPAKKSAPAPTKPQTVKSRTVSLWTWLQAHPLINLNGLCKTIGIDRANFVKGMIKGTPLPENTLKLFESQLEPYGYNCTKPKK